MDMNCAQSQDSNGDDNASIKFLGNIGIKAAAPTPERTRSTSKTGRLKIKLASKKMQ